ncbi:MAG: TonB-dependent receptor, partial [Prevotellaceae bacterium]|jgi:outer membrane receptor protein involved in Fe transport|nr:TonB-dependent receptor [Prevotellaceae bacterium]
MPYLDKSSFNFDFFDIAGIEVLRGPQGTLYGRNAMGGIVNVRTASPLRQQGTRFQVSYGSKNTVSVNASHAQKLGENVGISFGGSYHQTDGFFTNEFSKKPANALKSGAARLRLDWKMSEKMRLSYTLSGERSEQNGYAYGEVDSTGKVHNPRYNAPAGYNRTLVSNGLFVQYEGNNYTISSSTSHQFFDDHMRLDQDFTPDDFFTLAQKQRQHAVTEEIIVKSKSEKNYRWLFGTFGFYKNLNADAPVSINSNFISRNFPTSPRAPQLTIVTDSGSNAQLDYLYIPSTFESASYGAAVYHQSTYNNLILEGLSLTAGVRLDYEKIALQYYSSSRVSVKMVMPAMMGGRTSWSSSAQEPLYNDELSNDFLEFLPKIALQYVFGNGKYKIYTTAAKGYTSGGYNTQLFADLVQDKLNPKQSGTQIIYKQAEDSEAVNSAIYYQPEYCWSYEVGGAASFFDKKLNLDAAAFFIDTRNQQVALFVPSGLGRVMKNAGRSHSYGAEISANVHVKNLSGYLSYGYTHATFRQYTDSVKTGNSNYEEVSYKGKFVPFAPQHTLSVGAEYDIYFNSKMADKLTLSASYTGAGKVYFTAANSSFASQDFYSLLNAKVSVEKGSIKLGFWAKNLLNARYKAFYFENMGRHFAQRGNPLQAGVEVSMKF